eukprot:1181059-Alexandrium_andersonii.AAC.1
MGPRSTCTTCAPAAWEFRVLGSSAEEPLFGTVRTRSHDLARQDKDGKTNISICACFVKVGHQRITSAQQLQLSEYVQRTHGERFRPADNE